MPQFRAYKVALDRPLEVVVEGRDGSRAIVRGTLTAVPHAVYGGVALRIVVSDAVAEPLTD